VEIKRGIPVSQGVAVAPAFVLESEGARIARRFLMPEELPHEIQRFEKALRRSHREIDELGRRLQEKIDEPYDVSGIFRVHSHILQDPKLREQVTNLIQNRHFTPEYAVSQILRRYVKSLESTGDSYLLQRVRDFDDIEQRLLRNLLGEKREDLAHIREPVVVIARDLTPTQTASFDPARVLALATDAGGRTSHTAIIARALRIPAVVGVGELSASVSGGDLIVVDGTQGVVVVDPDELTLRRYKARARSREVIEEKIASEICNLPAITRDGHTVAIEANIEFPNEVPAVVQQGGSGVGLYRTEFLFHTSDSPPDEEAHFNAYMEAIRALGDHLITIRLLDLGADKFPVGFAERNPFLGCRSMRLLRVNPEMFRNQIRAILRASALGNVRFMFPLLATFEELRESMELVHDVMGELERKGVAYDKDIKVGMMIEVPSAALMADVLAPEVDFFSIGTNDLIQYTLAVDRTNEHVSHLYSPVDPAVLRLIKHTVEAAARAGIDVCICGEMAGDVLYTALLVGLGLQRLSMAPTAMADVKKLIRSITYEDARRTAERIMQMATPAEIETHLAEELRRVAPELLEQDEEIE